MNIMPTRRILLLLKLFAGAAVIALVVAVLAPVPMIRLFGYVALACALVGVALHLYLLRHADPHAWMVLRYQAATLPERANRRWRATFHHRHDLHKVQS
jgi:hypothetical protein